MITKKWVVAALAATVTLAGCAGQASVEQVGSPGPATVEDARATYDQVVAKVYGTPEQRRASAEAGWLRTQLAVASCMAERRQQYAMPPFQGLPDTGVAPGDVLAFAPPREDFGVGRRLKAFAAAGEPAQPALVDAGTAKQTAYTQAISGCATGEVTDAGNPKGQEVLDGQLVAVLTQVQESATPELPDDYTACLTAAGVPAKNLSDLYVKVELAYPPISYEKKSDATKADGWANGVAFEAKAAASDWECRAGAADAAVVAAMPAMQRFTADHAAELDTVAAGWAQASADVTVLRTKVN